MVELVCYRAAAIALPLVLGGVMGGLALHPTQAPAPPSVHAAHAKAAR